MKTLNPDWFVFLRKIGCFKSTALTVELLASVKQRPKLGLNS